MAINGNNSNFDTDNLYSFDPNADVSQNTEILAEIGKLTTSLYFTDDSEKAANLDATLESLFGMDNPELPPANQDTLNNAIKLLNNMTFSDLAHYLSGTASQDDFGVDADPDSPLGDLIGKGKALLDQNGGILTLDQKQTLLSQAYGLLSNQDPESPEGKRILAFIGSVTIFPMNSKPSVVEDDLSVSTSNTGIKNLSDEAKALFNKGNGTMTVSEKAALLLKAQNAITLLGPTSDEAQELAALISTINNIPTRADGTPPPSSQDLKILSNNTDVSMLGDTAAAIAEGGSLSDQAKASLMGRAMQLLQSGNLTPEEASLIQNFLHQLSRFPSQNPQTADNIFNNLLKETNLTQRTDLTPDEKVVIENYLKVVAQALALFSHIKSLIAQLDAQSLQAQNNAKLGTVKAQTDQAKIAFSEGLRKISEFIQAKQKEEEAKKLANSMKILMIFITIIMAIVTAVITALTAGAAAGPMLAALAVITTLMVEETASDGFLMGKLSDACGIKDEPGRSIFSAAVMIIIQIVAIVATGGALGIVAFANSAARTTAQTALEGAKLAASSVLKGVVQAMKDSLAAGVTRSLFLFTIASSILSSGMIGHIVMAIAKKCHASDEDAMIAAIVITAILAILMAILCGKLGGASKAGEGAGKVASAISSVGEAVGETVQQAGKVAEEVVEQAVQNAIRFIKKLLENMVKIAQQMFLVVGETTVETVALTLEKFVKIVSNAVTIGINSAQIKLQKEIMDLENIQADTARQLAMANALLQFLNTLNPGLDLTMQNLQKMIDQLMELGNSVYQMFMNMIAGLEKSQDGLVQSSSSA